MALFGYDYDKSATEFVIFRDGDEVKKSAQSTISRVTIDASTFLPRTCEIELMEPANDGGKYSRYIFYKSSTYSVYSYAQGNSMGELLFVGTLTSVESIVDEGSGMRTVFRLSDSASDMLSATKTRLFKEMTYSDVVKKVAGEYGLNPFSLTSTSRITTTKIKHDTIVQVNETDWDFICRLARELGYIAFVHPYTELKRPKAKLSWGPQARPSASGGWTGAKTFEVGDGRVIALRGMSTGLGYASKARVAGWDHKQNQAALGSESTSSDMRKMINLRRSAAGLGSKKMGPRTSVDRMASSTAEANAMAKGYARRLSGASVDLELVARGHPAARLNEAVKVKNAEQLEGDYLITALVHEFGGESGFITTLYSTGVEDRSLAGIQGEVATRLKLDGVYPAIVNSIEDPLKKGRVNLTLPWLDKTYITGWAQIVQMGAGQGVGWQALPAPKDEVLVAFENGQLETPYVIGGLFGKGSGKVPAAQLMKDGSPVKQVFTTKTGHQLIFDDEGDDSGITIRTKNGQTCSIVMSDKKGITISTKGEGGVTINSDADVAVTTKKSAKVTANEVSVTSKGAIKVNGKGTLDVSASNINLNATGSAKLKGASVTVEASGPLTLKGAVVKLN